MFFGSMGFGLAPDHSWLGFWPFLTGFGEETGHHSLVSLITWFSDKCSTVALVDLFVTDKGTCFAICLCSIILARFTIPHLFVLLVWRRFGFIDYHYSIEREVWVPGSFVRALEQFHSIALLICLSFPFPTQIVTCFVVSSRNLIQFSFLGG